MTNKFVISLLTVLGLHFAGTPFAGMIFGAENEGLEEESTHSCGQLLIKVVYTPRVGEQKRKTLTAQIPHAVGSNHSVTDQGILKTILVVNLGKAVQATLKAFRNTLAPLPTILQVDENNIGLRTIGGVPLLPDASEAKTRNQKLAAGLRHLLQQFRAGADGLNLRNDQKLNEVFVYLEKLASLIDTAKEGYDHGNLEVLGGGFLTRGGGGGPRLGGATRSFSAMPLGAPTAKGMTLATGGAQDVNQFYAKLDRHSIPDESDFDPEGFLRTFELPLLSGKPAADLVSADAGVLYDPSGRKLYVQVAFTSNVSTEAFDRPPLNLSLAVDISASMGEVDGASSSVSRARGDGSSRSETERKNRITWAKESAASIVSQLTDRDFISVVLFDDRAEFLSRPMRATQANKAILLQRIQGIEPRGSTDVTKALNLAKSLVAEASLEMKGDVVKRIVLISDVGHNQSATDGVVAVASLAAQSGVGLTVVGIGKQLEPELAKQISVLRGGNYIFVKDGSGLEKLARRIDLLATPVASDIAIGVEVKGLNAKLAKAYGANLTPGETMALDRVIEVPTLFFVESEDGGGTILLQFNLEP